MSRATATGRGGTVGAWFAHRAGEAPRHLRVCMERSLGERLDRPARETAERCGDAAFDLVTGLFSSERVGRDAAIDLLAADALVTYALEFAADDPAHFADAALDVMRRFGRLAEASA